MREPKADLIVAALAVALLSPGSAQARDYFEPFVFSMTSDAGVAVLCDGPYLRTSGCVPLGAVNNQEFYRAYNTIFPADGSWACMVSYKSDCSREDGIVGFYLDRDLKNIELHFSRDAGLSVNIPPTGVSLTVSSVLGRNGEADASPAQDIDTYSFAG